MAAGGGVIGFRLVDRAKVVFNQMDGPDREHDRQRDGQQGRYDEFQSILRVIADTRFDQPPGQKIIFR